MASSWTLADLMSELQDIATLVANNTSRSGTSLEELANKLVQQVIIKMGRLKFDASAAVRVQNALADINLPQALKDTIQSAVDELLVQQHSDDASGAQASCKTPQQMCLFVHRYLTPSKWSVLEDTTAPWAAKVIMIVKTLRQIGVNYLHEQTVKWCLALLFALHAEQVQKLPRYQDIHQAVDDFKTTYHASVVVCRSGVSNYPENPDELPSDLYQALCDKGETPVQKDVLRLAQLANSHIPLRGNSRLITEEKAREARERNNVPDLMQMLHHLNAASSSSAPGLSLLQKSNGASNSEAAPSLQLSNLSSGSGAALFKPASRKSVPMLASEGKFTSGTPATFTPLDLGAVCDKPMAALPAPEAYEVPEAHEAPAAPGAASEAIATASEAPASLRATSRVPEPEKQPPALSSEAYEQAAFAALTAGLGRSRGGGQGRGGQKGEGGPGSKKRPAAAEKLPAPAQKRPAAAVAGAASDWRLLDIGVPSSSEASKYSSRGSYTSKYSHDARKTARSQGYSDEQAKAMASAAYKAAGQLWDSM